MPAKGVALHMAWTTKPGAAAGTVHQIHLSAPSSLRNPKGIGIGSTRAEVVAAFGSRFSTESPPTPDRIVVGSIFDGVMFDMKGDRVESIFVGASAE